MHKQYLLFLQGEFNSKLSFHCFCYPGSNFSLYFGWLWPNQICVTTSIKLCAPVWPTNTMKSKTELCLSRLYILWSSRQTLYTNYWSICVCSVQNKQQGGYSVATHISSLPNHGFMSHTMATVARHAVGQHTQSCIIYGNHGQHGGHEFCKFEALLWINDWNALNWGESKWINFARLGAVQEGPLLDRPNIPILHPFRPFLNKGLFYRPPFFFWWHH